MNIGIVTTWFERGAAYVSRSYMESLSIRHRVYIYARGGEHYAKGDPLWDTPQVTWAKKIPNKPWSYVDWLEFKAWIEQNNLDAIIFNEQQSWEIVVKVVNQLNIPIGAYIDYYTKQTLPFFSMYDFVLCNTSRHYNVFKEHPHAIYIPWGTNLSAYRFRPRLPDGNVVFFHSGGMGGINLRKGTDIAVKSFRKVTGSTRLVIHSQVPLVNYGDETLRMVNSDKRIQFIEATVSTPGLYHLGDIYLYPSRLEGIGLSIAEALACGLPVITTNSAPMNEFVVHDFNGKLVPIEQTSKRKDDYYWPETVCSERALVEAMQFFVDHSQVLPVYKTRARTYAEEHLDWAKNSIDLADIVQSIDPVRRVKPDIRLKALVTKYENSLYPPIYKRMRSAVGRMGGSQIKQWLRRLTVYFQ